MRLGSLFSGYGGLEQGIAAVLPVETAWVSDIDRGACKILAHRYPDVPNLGDITGVDWSRVEPVDVLCGGFPCQDVSAAGRRAGLIHGTRSGLWYEFAQAIDALRPSLVVIENVRGLLSARGDTSEEFEAAERRCDLAANLHEWLDDRRHRALTEGRTSDAQHLTTRAHRLMAIQRRAVADRKRAERRIVRAIGTVLGTLADLGYDASWYGLRAADVGAPHGRFRVFVVAYPQGQSWSVQHGDGAATPRTSDTNGAGAHGEGGVDLRTAVATLPTPTARDWKNVGDPARTESRMAERGQPLGEVVVNALLPTPAVNDMGEGKTPEAWDEWTDAMKAKHGNGNGHGASLSVEARRLIGTPTATEQPRSAAFREGRTEQPCEVRDWGRYAAAIARWEHVLGRSAPPPTELGAKGNPRLSARFSEFLMGLPDGWVTDVPGITRNEALKACGNGVVPQQAQAALRHLLDVMAMAA